MDKPLVYVDEAEIRRVFNDVVKCEERVRSGEFRRVVKKSEIRTIPHEPEGTRSEFIQYVRANGQVVAGAHRYLRPDGTIGGRGRPDPKRIFLADKILAVRLKPEPSEAASGT